MGTKLTRGISGKDTNWKATFFKQMFILISSNINVDSALKLLLDGECANSKYWKILNNLYYCVRSGDTLSTALRTVGVIFSEVEINMVLASERIGKLDIALEQLADFSKKFLTMKRKILSAMIYPAIILSVSIVVLVVLSLFVIPRFEVMFTQSFGNYKMPWLTRTVIGCSKFFAEHIALIITVCVSLAFSFKLAMKTKKFRWLLDDFLLKLPVIGKVICNYNVCLFFKIAGILLKFGVPIKDCFLLAQTDIANKKI